MDLTSAALPAPDGPIADAYDVVAVGAGLGGLVAAITAVDLGLRALVVEKSALLGGVTAYSQGQLWLAAPDEARAAGIEDSPAAGAAYLTRLGAGFADPAAVAAYSALAPRVLRFLRERAGVPWRLVDLPDYYFPVFDDALPRGRYVEVDPFHGPDLGAWRATLRVSPHVPYRLTHDVLYSLPCGARSHTWDPAVTAAAAERDDLAMGAGLAAYLLRAALAGGVDVAREADVRSLTRTGGRVDGVVLEHGGVERRVVATRAVVLATGGYDWHPSLAASFEGNTGMTSAAPPTIVGDHLRLATEVGARLAQSPKPLRLSLPVPGTDDGRPMHRILGAMAMPHGMLVNRAGRRFGDESFYPSIGHALKDVNGATQELRNLPCWVVVDAQHRRRYAFGHVRPGDDFPPEWGVATADTIEELAVLAGIDPAGLVDEVARFNRFSAQDRDEDFGRGERPWAQINYGDREVDGNPCLGAIAEPPFHAYRPGLVGTGIVALGVDTDVHGRALAHDGTPVEGLYVVGNSAHLGEVGAGYQSGVANTRSAVFAHAGVRHAAGVPFTADELVV
ncbi:MAG TPA: FAD-dependent oxidoreductase [Nocardioides sp.]